MRPNTENPSTSAMRTLEPVASETELAALPKSRRRYGAGIFIATGLTFHWRQASTAVAKAGEVVVPDDIAADAAYIVSAAAVPGRWETNAASTGSSSDYKNSVKAVTTGNLAGTYAAGVLTLTATGALAAQDGITMAVGDRLGLVAQTAGLENGIFTITVLGTTGVSAVLTRATDADSDAEVTPDLQFRVEQGTLNADALYVLDVNGPVTVGSTALVFIRVSQEGTVTLGSGGTGIATVSTGISLRARSRIVFELTTHGGTGCRRLKVARTPGAVGTAAFTVTGVDDSGVAVADTGVYAYKIID